MSVLKTQTLFLESARGQGTPDRWTAYFNSGSIECAPDQQLRLSVRQFVGFNSYPNVTALNNALTINKLFEVDGTNDTFFYVYGDAVPHPFYIEHGIYTVNELLPLLTYDQPGNQAITATFNGQFRFECAEPFAMIFNSESWKVLGFTDGTARNSSHSSLLDKDIIYSDGNSQTLTQVKTVSQGTYTFYQLADAVDSQEIACQFVPQINGFLFSSDHPFTLTFPNESWKLLGFLNGAQVTATLNAASARWEVVSTQVINPITVESLLLSVEAATHGSQNLRMNVDGTTRASSILASIPVSSTPFEEIKYDASSKDLFVVSLLDKSITSLTFTLEDGRHRKVDTLNDYTLTLVVETVGHGNETRELKELGRKLDRLLDLTRLSVLSANSALLQ